VRKLVTVKKQIAKRLNQLKHKSPVLGRELQLLVPLLCIIDNDNQFYSEDYIFFLVHHKLLVESLRGNHVEGKPN
jgi:hypothetical protein